MNVPEHAIAVSDAVVSQPERASLALTARRSLAGQRTLSDVSSAEARFGLSLSGPEIRRRIKQILPWRLGRARSIVCVELTHYAAWIPDEALLVWEEARETPGFQDFCIMWPVYDRDAALAMHRPRGIDPWLIGWTGRQWQRPLHDSTPVLDVGPFHDNAKDRGIVLAYWDDAAIHPPQVK